MKFKINDFNAALRNKFSEFDGILFYGPDRGQVIENFNKAVSVVVDDVNDGFSVFEFSSSEIKSEPSKIIDEATTISFMGDRKVIKIKDASEDIVEPIKQLLAGHTTLEAFIVVAANELAPSSRLRSLFENNKRLIALPNYNDDGAGLVSLIKQTLNANGIKKIPDDVLFFLKNNFGENRTTTKMELEKLALYLYGKDTVTLEDAQQSVMDSSVLNIQDLPLAVAEGNNAKLSAILPRLLSEGSEPIVLLKIVLNHFKSLYFMAGEIEGGKSIDTVISEARPTIFFKLVPSYQKQLSAWNTEKIIKIISEINAVDIKCKTTGMPKDIIFSQLLFMICAMANKKV